MNNYKKILYKFKLKKFRKILVICVKLHLNLNLNICEIIKIKSYKINTNLRSIKIYH